MTMTATKGAGVIGSWRGEVERFAVDPRSWLAYALVDVAAATLRCANRVCADVPDSVDWTGDAVTIRHVEQIADNDRWFAVVQMVRLMRGKAAAS